MKEKQIAQDRALLRELAAQEQQIGNTICSASGNLAAINQQLQQQGIFEQYRHIHTHYVELASFKKDRQTRNEALKRALFLGWYQEVEPPLFTGLADLDEEKVNESYFALNKLLEKGWMQDEFLWMLAHYAQWDWVILQYTENKIHQLSQWVKSPKIALHPLPVGQLPLASLQNRGLMGQYFQKLGLSIGL